MSVAYPATVIVTGGVQPYTVTVTSPPAMRNSAHIETDVCGITNRTGGLEHRADRRCKRISRFHLNPVQLLIDGHTRFQTKAHWTNREGSTYRDIK